MKDNPKEIKKRYERSIKWQLMANTNKDSIHQDVVPFTVAEMEVMTPLAIIEGLKDYLDSEILGYTVPTDKYYSAINRWTTKHYSYSINKEDIFITTGVINAIRIAINTMTNLNDGIVLLTPSYNSFFDVIKNTHRNCVKVPLDYHEGYYSINKDLLEESFKDERNTMFILCSPHNPVGRVWTHEELQLIYDLANRHGVKVISDEIHADIIMPGSTFISYALIDPKAIICLSITKTFNLAGLKISNTIIKDPVIRKSWVDYTNMYGGGGANALAMRALEIAYTTCDEWYDDTLKLINDNFTLIKESLKNTRYIISPLQATYLLWINASHIPSIYTQLIKKNQIVAPGSWYGANSNYLRINIACPQIYIQNLIEVLLEIENDTQ